MYIHVHAYSHEYRGIEVLLRSDEHRELYLDSITCDALKFPPSYDALQHIISCQCMYLVNDLWLSSSLAAKTPPKFVKLQWCMIYTSDIALDKYSGFSLIRTPLGTEVT